MAVEVTTDAKVDTARGASRRPRIWLAGGGPAPHPLPTVRDTRQRVWGPDGAGGMQTADGQHHETWGNLNAVSDLIELR
jgi:hypothetical protein